MDTEDSYFSQQILQVRNANSQDLEINLQLNDEIVTFQLDTGSISTIINERTWNLLREPKLQNSDTQLRSYTGQLILLLGECDVKVTYKIQYFVLSDKVVKGTNCNFLGRDWLNKFRLDWQKIFDVKPVTLELSNSTSLQAAVILEEYEDVFEEGLGTIKPYTAKIKIRKNAGAKFHKARPVPYSMKAKGEKALNQLEEGGVITKISSSKWAAPVLKPSDVRICGDFKVSINSQIDADKLSIANNGGYF